MARLKPEQLQQHLKSGLAPIYVISGDEALLVQEAQDEVRRAARRDGFSQIERYQSDAQFQWDTLLANANALSLFADKKLIELRIPNGKPGDQGARALKEYAARPAEDTVLLLLLPKLDKRTESSAWFKALSECGHNVAIWPVNAAQLPRWLEKRLQAAGIDASQEAIEVLAAKVEGNLFAAAQEIEKLKLALGAGHVDVNTMANAVTDSARYNLFDLVDRALAAEVKTSLACLNGLRAEGTAPPVVLWALSNQLRTLLRIKEAEKLGRGFDAAAREARVWQTKLALVRACCQRLSLARARWLLRKCAVCDRVIKGRHSGDAWSELADITLGLAGVFAMNAKVEALMING